MTTPDILTTVGFEKTKLGSGDKEAGYKINESSLCSLLGSVLVCIGIMAFLTVSMVYDIRFEKKTLHKQMRVEEHHAATKLAQVHMELWSQYRDDILESHEAQSLLTKLDTSYQEFQSKYRGSTEGFAKDLSLNPDKASQFADKILHMVADMQKDNMKHAKRLLDHLVEAGKRSVALEKHVGREIMDEVDEENKRMKEDMAQAYNVSADEPQDLLRPMLEGFWEIFNDYEGEFGTTVRKHFEEGHPVYKQLTDLYERIQADKPPSETEVVEALDKIDLASVGAPLGQGRVLPVNDIVEELVMVPKVPHEKLKALEQKWRDGTQDSVRVLSTLEHMHKQGLVPGGWLQMGVHADEREEEAEEKKHND